METILIIIIAILICVIMLLIWCLYDAHKEIKYQTNLAKTFEQGYDKLRKDRGDDQRRTITIY